MDPLSVDKVDNWHTLFHVNILGIYPLHHLLIPKRSPFRRPWDARSTMKLLSRARISPAFSSFFSRSGTKIRNKNFGSGVQE